MAEPPTHPAKVEWSGENPGIYLRMEENGPFTCLVSFFRVVYSPHGPGHSLVILTDPSQKGERPGQVNACYTDNADLARYLNREFLAHFGAFKGTPNLEGLPVRPAGSFAHSGDSRRAWTETIRGDGIDISLTWADLQEPFLVQFGPELAPTGQHHLYSVFIPATRAEVVVNGVRSEGRVFPRDMGGRRSTMAFLAFSESWLR